MGHLSSCGEVHLNMGLDWLRLDVAGQIISGVIPMYPPSVPGAREAHETSKNPAVNELKTMLTYVQRAVVSKTLAKPFVIIWRICLDVFSSYKFLHCLIIISVGQWQKFNNTKIFCIHFTEIFSFC